MKEYPKIIDVKPQKGKRLLVTFSDGIKKLYDCSPLLKENVFKPLMNDALFKAVKADEHGYCVIWSDEIDLSESELWLHGMPASIYMPYHASSEAPYFQTQIALTAWFVG